MGRPVDPNSFDPSSPIHFQILGSAREVAAESDVVVTGLPKPPDVRRVFEGADGLLAGMDKGKVWIDHTTTDFGQGYCGFLQSQINLKTEILSKQRFGHHRPTVW